MTQTHPGSTALPGTGSGSGSSDDGVKAKAKDVASTAGDKVKDGVGSAQEAAVERLEGATSAVADKADERREHVAEVARSLQEKAQEFADSVCREQPQLGQVLQQAAGSIDSLVDYVERTPVEQMTSDFTTQMRRRPLLFAAGMFGAGFALTRALKPVGSLTGGSSQRELGTGTSYPTGTTYPTTGAGYDATRSLPTASAVDGGMH